MRASFAETRADHADPALRPRTYEKSFEEVFRAAADAAEELSTLALGEADPRRGVVTAWVRLLPFSALPGSGFRKRPHGHGRGWWDRFEPLLAQGWVDLRIAPTTKGRVEVAASLTLEIPFLSILASRLLKNYLWWLDTRLGMPRKP